jgi:hypothetical protein
MSSNGAEMSRRAADARLRLTFAETKPLPTWLFSVGVVLGAARRGDHGAGAAMAGARLERAGGRVRLELAEPDYGTLAQQLAVASCRRGRRLERNSESGSPRAVRGL